MKKSVDLIIHSGRTIPQRALKCVSCGKSTVSMEEYERVRKVLHPSLFDKIRSFFKPSTEAVDLFKGRVL
ncbi:hypothetical protein J4464_06890 [Candidatus Woesearchaeota archaeon]|nr:hypothetical protein [Candidatus Woesearchaeota archaeon]